jgi:hypothetical protein
VKLVVASSSLVSHTKSGEYGQWLANRLENDRKVNPLGVSLSETLRERFFYSPCDAIHHSFDKPNHQRRK